MILVDVNLLLYAYISGSPQHDAARDWLDSQINAGVRIGLPWHSLLGFLRIVTNPRVTSPPETLPRALAQVEAWLTCENVWIPAPSERHAAVLFEVLREPSMRGALVADAHLAALAIEHGLTLFSADSDFVRFSSLRWVNPFAAV
ncbi:MAG: VapC toxin family PIN domain ribonuclease [Alphaproteobacteria bacterium]|nr:MAG: VapC toxin family PIN domain ribonuclease [Alphaproteobacteria bacterium]